MERFDPLTLSYSDRYNVAAIFACLINQAGRHRRRGLKFLRNVIGRLGIIADDAAVLGGLTGGYDDPVRYASLITDDATRFMVLWDLLVLAIGTGGYDARDREGLRRMASALGVPWPRVTALEDDLRRELSAWRAERERERPQPASSRRWLKIAGTSLAVGIALAATGGFAAPAIGGLIGTYFMELTGAAAVNAGLAWLGGGALAAGGYGMAGGAALVASLFGIGGGGLAGYKMHRRTKGLEDFAFEPLDGREGMHSFVGISGFLSQRDDLKAKWAPLSSLAGHGEHLVLRWESQHLIALGKTLLTAASSTALRKWVLKTWVERATKVGARRLAWPTAVLDALSIIDNPWSMARDRATAAGDHLASLLMRGHAGNRPVTLVGFSLGARLIFAALERLSKEHAEGIIEHAILLGGAVAVDADRWTRVSEVVAGRLVNVYSDSDWVLRYLYRAAESGECAAGSCSVGSPHVENFDATPFVSGHTAYADALEQVLRMVGLDAPPSRR